MSTVLNAKVPDGALRDKWDNYKADAKLVNPNNKRKFKVIVVGTGLAGASAAATLAELGYRGLRRPQPFNRKPDPCVKRHGVRPSFVLRAFASWPFAQIGTYTSDALQP